MKNFDPNVLPPYIHFFTSLRDVEWTTSHPNDPLLSVAISQSVEMFKQWRMTDTGLRPQHYYDLKELIAQQAWEEIIQVIPGLATTANITSSQLTYDSYLKNGWNIGVCGPSLIHFNPDEALTGPWMRYKMDGLGNTVYINKDAQWGSGTSMSLNRGRILPELICIDHPEMCVQ